MHLAVFTDGRIASNLHICGTAPPVAAEQRRQLCYRHGTIGPEQLQDAQVVYRYLQFGGTHGGYPLGI